MPPIFFKKSTLKLHIPCTEVDALLHKVLHVLNVFTEKYFFFFEIILGLHRHDATD